MAEKGPFLSKFYCNISDDNRVRVSPSKNIVASELDHIFLIVPLEIIDVMETRQCSGRIYVANVARRISH